AGPATRCAAAAPKAAPAAKPAAKIAPVKKTVKAPAKKPAVKKPAPKTVGKAKPPHKPPPKAVAAEHLMPVAVLRLPPRKHLAFDVGLCVVTTAGRLQCLAAKDSCTLDTPWPGLASTDYVVGNCARLTDGNAKCWSVDTKSRLVSAVTGVNRAISVST